MASASWADVMCQRCGKKVLKSGKGDDSPINWMGWIGHRLCWEIYLGMWVMTQDDRAGALAFVDSIVGKRK